ncbi:MAG: helix-turn-helix transcriptional regulator [Eubacteriaceae bacterium]|jgi:predicted transcriptional regulator YheO|nr:helix-turn-helix transcriptional regulator [Eubacteriaceae bacterium]
MHKKLEPYVSLVNFLADFLGSNTEVVLHDLTDWDKSIVAIRNGHISGRKIGAPVTGLALDIVKSEIYKEQDYKVNYKGMSAHGYTVKSATYFIKDEKGVLIGLMCINMDCEKLTQAREVIDSIIRIGEGDLSLSAAEETFSLDVNDLVRNNIDSIVPGNLDRLRKMKKREKVELVAKLQDMGTFMVKGTLPEVAELLGVSVPTMYRYLANVKKDGTE